MPARTGLSALHCRRKKAFKKKNPKPQTLNPKPSAPRPKPKVLNPQPSTFACREAIEANSELSRALVTQIAAAKAWGVGFGVVGFRVVGLGFGIWAMTPKAPEEGHRYGDLWP